MKKFNLGRIMPINKGEYSASTAYEFMDIVYHDGSSYWCIENCQGVLPTDTTYWTKVVSRGVDGFDAYMPLKGWFESSTALTTAYPTPAVGDYAYVQGVSSVAIYVCNTAGTWSDSGQVFNPAYEQTFMSGESLDNVRIVDNLESNNPSDVLSAKQGKVLDEKVSALGPKISGYTVYTNNAVFNDCVKEIFISGIDLTNVNKFAFNYTGSTSATIRLYNGSTAIAELITSNHNQIGIKDEDGLFLFTETSGSGFILLLLDDAKYPTLSASSLELMFNYTATDLRFSPCLAAYAASIGGFGFSVINITLAETSKRIDKDGQVVSGNANWGYTTPISVSKGDVLWIRTAGNNNTAVVSKTDSSATYYTPITFYNGDDSKPYIVRINEDGYVALTIYHYGNWFVRKFHNNLVSLISEIVGIESFVQTTTSTESGGTNVATITLTNGVSSTFEVKNGAQGATGSTGATGPQGAQGNSGYTGAIGELEVVNNIEDGGATAALSAEQGKILGNLVDYNNIPIVHRINNPKPIASATLIATDWTSDENASSAVGIEKMFDEVHGEMVDTLKFSLGAVNTKMTQSLSSPVNVVGKCIRVMLRLDPSQDVNDYKRIDIIVGSGGVTQTLRANRKVFSPPSDPTKSWNGWICACISVVPKIYDTDTTGSSIDFTNIDRIGLHLIRKANTATSYAYLKQLDIVQGMDKPGICVVIDNFNEFVPAMADYAASKGVKLNLSIIPNWIGRQEAGFNHATIAQINANKRQGHLIFNHTWNHVITSETYAEIREGITLADNWMVRNGFSRGAKFLSVPSSLFNEDRYQAYMQSESLSIYHHWMPFPGNESANEDRYLITYPYYPANRYLTISGLDYGVQTAEKMTYYINLAQAAVNNKGIAIIGFHGRGGDNPSVASDVWKAFIDGVAAIEGIYCYGIDELMEGLFY